jgi:hypothetical protein
LQSHQTAANCPARRGSRKWNAFRGNVDHVDDLGTESEQCNSCP